MELSDPWERVIVRLPKESWSISGETSYLNFSKPTFGGSHSDSGGVWIHVFHIRTINAVPIWKKHQPSRPRFQGYLSFGGGAHASEERWLGNMCNAQEYEGRLVFSLLWMMCTHPTWRSRRRGGPRSWEQDAKMANICDPCFLPINVL